MSRLPRRGWSSMCDQAPGSAVEALRAVRAGLDYLTGPDAALLDPAALGGVLTSLGELQAKFTAAHAGFLRRFDAAGAHDGDGYNTSPAWLSAMTQLKPGDARAAVAQMRTLARHPHLAGAMAAGAISPSWTSHLDRLTRKLPAGAAGRGGGGVAGGPDRAGERGGGAVPGRPAQPG
jgi:hypothetical protein